MLGYNQTIDVSPLHVTALQYSFLFTVILHVFEYIFSAVIVTVIKYFFNNVFMNVTNYNLGGIITSLFSWKKNTALL